MTEHCNFKRFDKAPTAIAIYEIDWSEWLQTSETILTSTWTAQSGITVVDSSILSGSERVTVLLSGGTLNASYELVNTITTSSGQTEPRTIIIDMVEK